MEGEEPKGGQTTGSAGGRVGVGCHGAQSWPQSAMTVLHFGFPEEVPKDSIFLTMSIPSTTLPNTTCFPSSLQTKSSV